MKEEEDEVMKEWKKKTMKRGLPSTTCREPHVNV
jgi:hypothetical protein